MKREMKALFPFNFMTISVGTEKKLGKQVWAGATGWIGGFLLIRWLHMEAQ